MSRLLFIFLSALVLAPSPALAKSAGAAMWVVTQMSGDARVVHAGLQPVSLKANLRLAPGDVVMTGATGRATLVHDADYIVVAPRSELRLPTEAQPTGFTRVIQNLGTMLFKVQHTGVPHFAVDTPMLAAVVKGTTFTVVVDKDRSAVQVTQGVVQVTALDGGMSRLVEGGRTVFINRADPRRLLDADSPAPAAKTGTSSTVRIKGTASPSVASIAALTDGLVRPAAAPRAPATAPTQVATAEPVEVVGTTAAVGPSAPGPTSPGVAPVASSPTQPVVAIADTTVPAVTAPLVDAVDTSVPAITEPVVDLVETTVPAVTEPVTNIVETTVPAVIEPVTNIVEATIPAVIEPVTNIVETTVPAVIEPVTNIVETTVPAVIEPVTNIVETTVPTVIEPVTNIVETTVPAVTEPVVDIVETTIPAVTEPVVDVVDTTVQTVTKTIGGLLSGFKP
jgi:hypothetical protein